MHVCHLKQVDHKEHQAESPLWYLQKEFGMVSHGCMAHKGALFANQQCLLTCSIV